MRVLVKRPCYSHVGKLISYFSNKMQCSAKLDVQKPKAMDSVNPRAECAKGTIGIQEILVLFRWRFQILTENPVEQFINFGGTQHHCGSVVIYFEFIDKLFEVGAFRF